MSEQSLFITHIFSVRHITAFLHLEAPENPSTPHIGANLNSEVSKKKQTGNKTSLNKFKKIEIISSIFSKQNVTNLEINHKKKTEKHTKTWRLNNMLLNNEWANN